MVLNYSRSLAEDFAGEQQGGAGWWAAGVPQMDREYQTEPFYFSLKIGPCLKTCLVVTSLGYAPGIYYVEDREAQ